MTDTAVVDLQYLGMSRRIKTCWTVLVAGLGRVLKEDSSVEGVKEQPAVDRFTART